VQVVCLVADSPVDVLAIGNPVGVPVIDSLADVLARLDPWVEGKCCLGMPAIDIGWVVNGSHSHRDCSHVRRLSSF
jgi:hypothetical protein